MVGKHLDPKDRMSQLCLGVKNDQNSLVSQKMVMVTLKDIFKLRVMRSNTRIVETINK